MKFLGFFFAAFSLFAAEAAPGEYIVELTEAPVLERLGPVGKAALRQAAAGEYRARVRAAQRSLRPAVERDGAAILDTLDTVINAFVVRGGDPERLRRLAGVRRVTPNWRMRLLLDRAIIRHGVPEAWNTVGYDNAGRGIKIGIIDSGVEVNHPAFQNSGLEMPAGFPKANREEDLAQASSKVIVVRNYARGGAAPAGSDVVGHGTAVAMAAAGGQASGPLATITGVAPQAWLGAYKMSNSPEADDIFVSSIIRAVEDAVNDGMDVLNLSLGIAGAAPRPEDDPQVDVLERASAAGIVVVVAAGNDGPNRNTMTSPGTSTNVIAVGAMRNDRVFGATARIEGGDGILAVPASGVTQVEPIAGELVDVSTIDGNGLACAGLRPGSLTGRIAFIARGECFFEDKLLAAQGAGAIGALVYSDAARPDAGIMAPGGARIPSMMISHAAGLAIRDRLSASGPLPSTLNFSQSPAAVDGNGLAGFSSKGPNVNFAIKPDMVAVGESLYVATQSAEASALVFDASGYTVEQGTSFSSPMVAGAAAVLRAARPGLTSAQYRSLLVNHTQPAFLRPGTAARVQEAGTGGLFLPDALRSTLAMSPVSFSFGTGGGDATFNRTLRVTNLGAQDETVQVSVARREGSHNVEVPTEPVRIAAGGTAEIAVRFTGSGMTVGEHEGFILLQSSTTGLASRVAYWYGVPDTQPRVINVLSQEEEARPGALVNDAIQFKIDDNAGIGVRVEPSVTAFSGGGAVLDVIARDRRSPGLYTVNVRLGAGAGVNNVFRIEAGGLTRDITIRAR